MNGSFPPQVESFFLGESQVILFPVDRVSREPYSILLYLLPSPPVRLLPPVVLPIYRVNPPLLHTVALLLPARSASSPLSPLWLRLPFVRHLLPIVLATPSPTRSLVPFVACSWLTLLRMLPCPLALSVLARALHMSFLALFPHSRLVPLPIVPLTSLSNWVSRVPLLLALFPLFSPPMLQVAYSWLQILRPVLICVLTLLVPPVSVVLRTLLLHPPS